MKFNFYNSSYFLIIVAVFLLLSCPVHAQPNWLWVNSGGSTGVDQMYNGASCTDASGNIYYTGYFTGNATIEGTALTGAGGQDIFVCKFDKNGNKLWVVSAGGTGNDVGRGIGVDGGGNVYVSGYFDSPTIVFNGITATRSGTSLRDIFLLKYTQGPSPTNITPSTITRFGSTGDDGSTGLAVTNVGDCYMTGIFAGTVSFGSISLVSNTASIDVFVTKLNSTGVVQWAKRGGGSSGDNATEVKLNADQTLVYIVGYIQGSATFSSVSVSSPVPGASDIFIAQYNASTGLENWIRAVGGSGSDSGNGIAISPNGNVNFIGYFQSTASFGAAGSVISAGATDIFIAQYNSSGTAIWVSRAGSSLDETAYDIGVDQNNSIYVTGVMRGTVTFGTLPSLSTAVNASTDTDFFLVRYSDAGLAQFSIRSGGTGLDAGFTLLVDNSNRIFIGGYYSGTGTFGSFSKTNAGTQDLFFAMLNVSYTWNGSISTAWNSMTNWTPNGIPGNVTGTVDNVTIVNGVNQPLLNATSTIANLTMTAGTLNLNTFSLTATNVSNFNGGTINNGTINSGTASVAGVSSTYAGTTFGATVYSRCNDIYLNGSNFSSTGSNNFIKTGSAANYSIGGNTFTGTALINNSGTGGLFLGGDAYNNTVTYTNSNTGGIYPAYTGTTTYNGISLVCTSSSTLDPAHLGDVNYPTNGIQFGQGGGASTLLNLKNIVVGGGGFTAGVLELKNFTQQGTGQPSYSLTTTVNSKITFSSGTVFNSVLTTNSPQLELNGATFNNNTTFVKTGTIANICTGGNTFGLLNGTTVQHTFSINCTAGSIRLAGTNPDTYNSNATFQTGVSPAYNGFNIFKGNITTSAANLFGGGNGVVYMDNPNVQLFTGSTLATEYPTINRLYIDKTTSVAINNPPGINVINPIKIGVNLTFITNAASIINNTSAVVIFNDNATVTNPGGLNFFTGNIQKIGDEGFLFPLGKGSAYRPIQLSGTGIASANISAQYYNTPHSITTLNGTLLKDISNCEYWAVSSAGVTYNNITVTLFWNSVTCSQINNSEMLVAEYPINSAWSAQAGTVTGNNVDGSVFRTLSLNSSTSAYTLGYRSLLFLNTQSVNQTYFTITGADNYHTNTAYPFTSGPSGTGSGIMKIHPGPSSSIGVEMGQPASTDPDPLTLTLGINSTYNLISVKMPFETNPSADLSPKFYTYSGNTLSFRLQPPSSAPVAMDITTNLINGLLYTRPGTFSITVPSPGFNSYNLRIINLSGTIIYSQTGITASPINWTAGAAPTPPAGTYKFELDIVSGGSVSNTYYGQFILQ
jgi:hypothetical protein